MLRRPISKRFTGGRHKREHRYTFRSPESVNVIDTRDRWWDTPAGRGAEGNGGGREGVDGLTTNPGDIGRLLDQGDQFLRFFIAFVDGPCLRRDVLHRVRLVPSRPASCI